MPRTTDAHELALELTTQELLALPDSIGTETDHSRGVHLALRTGASANADWARISPTDHFTEIEFSAQEIDALLSGLLA